MQIFSVTYIRTTLVFLQINFQTNLCCYFNIFAPIVLSDNKPEGAIQDSVVKRRDSSTRGEVKRGFIKKLIL